MDSDMGDHPPIAQKHYALLLKHAQWVQDELEMFEKWKHFTVFLLWYKPLLSCQRRPCLEKSLRNYFILTIMD